MIKKILALTCLLIIFSVSGSFAQMQESRLDLDYGTSYKLQKYNQILNPDADKNLEPVENINGKAAQEINIQYLNSFKETDKAPVYQLSIGGESK